MFASRYGHIAICTLLLKNKSNPDSRNQFTSALILAATNDYFDVCSLLITHCANLMMIVNGRTALDVYSNGSYNKFTPTNIEKRRVKLLAVFTHPDTCWNRKWHMMNVMTGCGFRPLLIRLKELESQRDNLIAQCKQLPSILIDTPEKRKAYKIFQVFACDGLLRLIVSFL